MEDKRQCDNLKTPPNIQPTLASQKGINLPQSPMSKQDEKALNVLLKRYCLWLLASQ